MRVGIVNDLRMATETLRRIIESSDGLEVAWTAVDGRDAVSKTAGDRPDLILMDLVMPVMDGAEATSLIMKTHPCPILVVTATIEGNARRVVKAMAGGAVDAVETPTMGLDGSIRGGAPLLDRIAKLQRDPGGFRTSLDSPAIRDAISPPSSVASVSSNHRPSVVLLGASTGGPQSLRRVLSSLPTSLHVPIVIVQHIDHRFVSGLTNWLSETTGHQVVGSRPGPMRPGEVVVAAAESHLVLTEGGYDHRLEPADSIHRPSVDQLFMSAAACTFKGIAVLLTGMGTDGAEGMAKLRAAGWHTIAQDEATSAVWGMPAAAIRAGGAMEILSIDEIGDRVASRLGIVGAE
ncbi:MAG: chemotaxis-specific protein-glutamate methyltransferase CheB [Planctomycetota bacterium]|jgi:two-component system, chemotaxis family, response regulator WspF|nr:chemotaxis-specific protein-glutamate methyltransferase CheB [Planctomycetota bacterium]MDA1026549.1 chemotaxis-specific protein-glutamate methyltransferase CheB [Planctomycetota bacterium]